jgi:hypothetical protein
MTHWTQTEKKFFRKLNSPFKIQLYLDSLPYNIDKITRTPRQVMKSGKAHCFDAAIFAAAVLQEHGHKPLLIDLRSNHEDDDHVLAVFQQAGCWGAIGKSNYTGCRYRDPVFRSLRELAISYFVVYFNLAGVKTLREYSVPFDLRKVKDVDWRRGDCDLDFLSQRLDAIRHYDLISPRTEKLLAPADDRSFRAETLGLDPRGAFKVKGARI